MRIRSIKLVIGITLLITPAVAQREGAAPTAPPRRTVRFPEIPPGSVGMYEAWSNGRLIQYHSHGTQRDPIVTVFDKHADVIAEPRLWFDDTQEMSITNIAIAKSGAIVMSGGVMSSTAQIANFVAQFGSNGKLIGLVRTAPFVPMRVCAGDDNTIWAFGWERDRSGTYELLRHFDVAKGQIGAELNSGNVRVRAVGRPADVHLECLGDTVLVYDALHGELVEYSTRTATVKRIPVETLPARMSFTGFAATDATHIFGSMHQNGTSVDAAFSLDTQTSPARWTPVSLLDDGETNGSFGQLLGVDGDELVHANLVTGVVRWSRIKMP